MDPYPREGPRNSLSDTASPSPRVCGFTVSAPARLPRLPRTPEREKPQRVRRACRCRSLRPSPAPWPPPSGRTPPCVIAARRLRPAAGFRAFDSAPWPRGAEGPTWRSTPPGKGAETHGTLRHLVKREKQVVRRLLLVLGAHVNTEENTRELWYIARGLCVYRNTEEVLEAYTPDDSHDRIGEGGSFSHVSSFSE